MFTITFWNSKCVARGCYLKGRQLPKEISQVPLTLPLVWQFILHEIDQISSMTFREYVEIVATWHHEINKKQYDCKNQIAKMQSAQRIEAHKNRNGCGRISTVPRQVQGIVQYHNCYCDHLHTGFDHLVYLQGQYEKGMLPYKGSLSDQPNKIIEIIKLIERLKLDRELKIQEAQSRKGVK